MITHEAIGQACITLYTHTELKTGVPCTVSHNNVAAAAKSGGAIAGIVADCKKGMATVIVRGFVTVKYSGTAPALGMSAICAGENGSVTAAESGNCYLVTQVDATNKTVTFML